MTKDQAYKLLRLILVLVWLVALAGLGAWVWTVPLRDNDQPVPLPSAEPRQLKVWAILDGEKFLTWLPTRFHELHPDVTVEILREYPGNVDAFKNFKIGVANDLRGVDVILGGLAEYHERSQAWLRAFRTEDVRDILRLLPTERRSRDNRWFAFYMNYLGIVWDHRRMPDEWRPRGFEDIARVGQDQRVHVPNPATSSAARVLLGGQARYGTKILRQMFSTTEARKNPGGEGPRATEAVASGVAVAAIEWMHDGRREATENKRDCLRAWMPEDQVPALGAVSVVASGPGRWEDALAFLQFLFSKEVAIEHYRRTYRVPAAPGFLESLRRLMPDEDYWLDHLGLVGNATQEHERLARDDWDEFTASREVFLKSLSVPDLSADEVQRAKKQSSGCGPLVEVKTSRSPGGVQLMDLKPEMLKAR